MILTKCDAESNRRGAPTIRRESATLRSAIAPSRAAKGAGVIAGASGGRFLLIALGFDLDLDLFHPVGH
jgi:hypothetical protein